MLQKGLQIIKSKSDITHININYAIGSDYEKPGLYGVTHLIEHCMCAAHEHLEKDFERSCISVNAQTGCREMIFYINGLTDEVLKYAADYVTSILNYIPTEEVFNREKRIVIEEVESMFIDNQYVLIYNTYVQLYNDYGPGGRIEDLENLTYESFLEYLNEVKKRLFNITIFTNADLDLDLEFDFVDDRTGIKFEPNKAQSPILKYSQNEQPLTYNFFITEPINKSYYGCAQVLINMLGNSLTSILNIELRIKRSLTYGVQCGTNQKDEEILIEIDFMTTSEYDEYKDVLEDIFINNPYTYFTEEHFNDIKSMLQNNKLLAKENDDINYHAYDEYYNMHAFEKVQYKDIQFLIDNGLFKNIKFNYVRV